MSQKETSHLTRREMLKRSAGVLAAGLAAPQALFGSSDRGGTPVNVALLGAAHVHLERYVRFLEDDSNVRVTTVFDETPEIARKAEELTRAPRADSLEDVLGRDDVDAVIILSENVKHEKYAVAAAQAGKHMFVEKPLDIRGEGAKRIADAVEEAGVLFQTGYFMQSMNQLRFLREVIRDGSFGKITRLRLQYAHGGSLGNMWDGHHAWMIDLPQVGRGALGDLGIHSLNALLWITEGDPVADVSAYVDNVTGGGNGIDEYGEAVLRFESGLVATIGAGYVDKNDVNRFEVSGTEGHAYLNRGRLFITCPNLTGTSQERYWSDFPDALDHPFSLFLAALHGNEVPLVAVRDAARDVQVMDDIYAAAQRESHA